MLIDEYSEKVLQKLKIWEKTLETAVGLKTTSIRLYHHYSNTLLRSGSHPVSQNVWGQFMGRRYPKGKDRGLTAYMGVGIKGEPEDNPAIRAVDHPI